jgi:hypothetical protein
MVGLTRRGNQFADADILCFVGLTIIDGFENRQPRPRCLQILRREHDALFA